MALMSKELHTRLSNALRVTDLRVRNWSTSEDRCFAVYTKDDDYVGLVHIDEAAETMRSDAGKGALTKRDAALISSLLAAWKEAGRARG